MVLTAIIGQCIGGARYDRAKDYLKCALKYGCGLLVPVSYTHLDVYKRQVLMG